MTFRFDHNLIIPKSESRQVLRELHDWCHDNDVDVMHSIEIDAPVTFSFQTREDLMLFKLYFGGIQTEET